MRGSNFSESPFIFNMTNKTNQSNCPLNEFCSAEAAYLCKDKPLNLCKYCNVAIVYILIVIYFLMACAIFTANGMIVAVYVYRYTIKIAAKSDPIRISLAVADILTGVQVFAMVLPEMAWKITSTGAEDVALRSSSNKSTWQCGILLITCFSSSLYHLILFGYQRLSAIAWPWSYKRRSPKSVYISLVVVWLIAGFTATIPSIFPKYFYYCRRQSLCFVCSKYLVAYFGLYAVFLFIPFIIMTAISFITAIVAHYKLKVSLSIRKNAGSNQQKNRSFTMQQVSAFKTVALMQVGFTLSVGPALLGIVLALLDVPCKVLDPYETACFILFFSNSLVNAIVYSVRDPKFRQTVVYLLAVGKRFFCKMQNTELPSPPYSISYSNGNGGRYRVKASSS